MPGMLFLCITALAISSELRLPRGSCTSPLDCNARKCNDCSCDNSVCACADGWSGDHCQTPFCVNRTECSNHGDCHQTLRNITCNCDSGFMGRRCGTCSKMCRHGGAANPKCTACGGCLGAWTGSECETYNHSVPVAGLLAVMQENYEAVQQQLNSSYHLLCTTGRECPGWGVDIFDGRVTNLMLTMTPNHKKIFHGFVAPQQVNITPFAKPEPNFADGAGVFAVPSDVVSYVNDIVGHNKGLRGLYGQSWNTILDSYFDSPADEAVSVVQGQLVLFEMNIPASMQGQFDRHFVETLQQLPGNYSTSDEKTLFNRFFELYGTSMVVQSKGGGLVEQRSRWKSPLIQTMNKSILLTNAQIDFSASTGLGGHNGVLDPTYLANRLLDPGNSSGGYFCYGGHGTLCTKGNTTKWQASLSAQPVMLSYTTAPLSQLLSACPHTASDPTLRVAMETAVSGYLHMKNTAWAAVNKCPKPGCNGHGSCAHPAEQCACSTIPPTGSGCMMHPFIGRMCSRGGGIGGGTRAVQFNDEDKISGTLSCVNGEWTDPGCSFAHCTTDAKGRVRVVVDNAIFPGCTGPWSSGAAQGANSSCQAISGHPFNCTFL